MQVKLTKIKSTHNNIGDEPMVGDAPVLPAVGYNFSLLHGSRRLTTTEVTDLVFLDEKTYEFQTRNSTYKLELL